MRQRIAQIGFSLIEVLVTIVIFSVGLLAVSVLQTVSKQATFEAMQRTTASHVAFGLLEDMRSNGPGLVAYVAKAQIGQGSITATSAVDCTSMNTPCSGAEVAARDLWFWETMLDGGMEASPSGGVGGLVSPVACITGPAGGVAGMYTVTIAWRGMVGMTDLGLDVCGTTSGQYGTGNIFRRVLQVPTFIDPNI